MNYELFLIMNYELRIMNYMFCGEVGRRDGMQYRLYKESNTIATEKTQQA